MSDPWSFAVSGNGGSSFGACKGEKKEVQEENNYNTYLQTIYGRENGIPGGCANDIVQTNDGVLWIGTYGGLYRYNGSEFRWVDEYESVKTVNCLYTDEEGRLWVGTNDSGVSIFINESIANVVSEKRRVVLRFGTLYHTEFRWRVLCGHVE